MGFSFFNFALIFVTAYVLTVIGVGVWRLFALKQEHLDIPNERSSHSVPTPRGGGIVIFTVTVGFLAFWAWQNENLPYITPFLTAASIVATISWLDDLYGVSSLVRLAVHTIAAIIIIYRFGYFTTNELSFLAYVQYGEIIGQILTVVWIVGLTNAYNFMDGIDGIAGTQGLIAGIGWSLIGLIFGIPVVVSIGGLMAATCLGFLWHNWHPARIFMGDVSSAFLGFTLAVFPLFVLQHTKISATAIIIGLLLVWTFVFDTGLTFIRRALRGENVLIAHRSHLYQRLVIAGLRHDTVTIIYGVLSGIGVVLALCLSVIDKSIAAVILFVLSLGLWFFVWKKETRRANSTLVSDLKQKSDLFTKI